MSDAFDNVVGGKLKLKGSGIGKKKKKSKDRDDGLAHQAAAAVASSSSAASSSNAASAALPSTVSSGHTAAELRRLEKQQQRHLEKLEKGEVKSHREKVQDLNTYLGNMTDHYDLPRVSKGN